MAQLYRRIQRFPSRGGLALIATLALLLGATTGASAQAISVELLAQWGEQLGDDDAATRAQAFDHLSTLPSSALPALRERIPRLRRPVLDSEASYEAVRKFRHTMGSRRADDMVDIAPGVLPWLETNRDRMTVRMAERLALLRSLEAMGNAEAGRAICDLWGIDMVPWRWEAKRVLSRHGAAMLPMLLEARSHDDAGVRRFARWGIGELRLRRPGQAVQTLMDDPARLSELLLAYASSHDFDAMPVVVSFVDDEDEDVRAAARSAMQSYGRNGVWMLRRAHRNLLGERADAAWGWRSTMERLYAALDTRRLAPLYERLDAALLVGRGGDLAAMIETFDDLLRVAPELERRSEMASGYAALAALRVEAGALEESRVLYHKAARLAGAGGAEYRAEALFADAELRRADGVADGGAYREVLSALPDHEGAQAAIGELAPPALETGDGGGALASALLLVLAGLGLFFYRGGLSMPRVPGLATARHFVGRVKMGPIAQPITVSPEGHHTTSPGLVPAPSFDDDDDDEVRLALAQTVVMRDDDDAFADEEEDSLAGGLIAEPLPWEGERSAGVVALTPANLEEFITGATVRVDAVVDTSPGSFEAPDELDTDPGLPEALADTIELDLDTDPGIGAVADVLVDALASTVPVGVFSSPGTVVASNLQVLAEGAHDSSPGAARAADALSIGDLMLGGVVDPADTDPFDDEDPLYDADEVFDSLFG